MDSKLIDQDSPDFASEVQAMDKGTGDAAAAKIDALAKAKIKEMVAQDMMSAVGSKKKDMPDLGGLV